MQSLPDQLGQLLLRVHGGILSKDIDYGHGEDLSRGDAIGHARVNHPLAR